MMMFESSHFPEMKQALAQNPNMIKILERYFQKQINAGVLQKIDAQSIAQSFISMLFGYAIENPFQFFNYKYSHRKNEIRFRYSLFIDYSI